MAIIIPVDKIDFGIRKCLQNANVIMKACETVFNAKEEHGYITVIENAPEISVVLYYYALEELGKAIKLESERDAARESGKDSIDATSWFIDHDEKLEAAIHRYGNEWHILEADPIPVSPSLEEFEFHTVEYSQPSIRNFIDRSNLLLTDYNRSSGHWGRFLESGTTDEMEKKIPQFDKLLHDILTGFIEDNKLPHLA